jgi:hypothetical protein
VGVSLGGLELTLSADLVFVSPLIESVEFGLDLGHALLSGNCSIDVGVRATALAARDDLFATIFERSGVEHDFREKHNATPAGKARGAASLDRGTIGNQPPSGTLSRRANRESPLSGTLSRRANRESPLSGTLSR